MIKKWLGMYKYVCIVVIADNTYQGPGSQKLVEKNSLFKTSLSPALNNQH